MEELRGVVADQICPAPGALRLLRSVEVRVDEQTEQIPQLSLVSADSRFDETTYD